MVLLNLNPGHSPEDEEAHKIPAVKNALLKNLRHEPQQYPFYYLNPQIAHTPGGQWWARRLAALLDQELDPKRVSQRLCVVEWFPYHSRKACFPKKLVCASQDYSFDIAKKMFGAKLLMGMRARPHWQAVDERFGSIPYLKNPQCCYISPGNAGKELFGRVLRALQ